VQIQRERDLTAREQDQGPYDGLLARGGGQQEIVGRHKKAPSFQNISESRRHPEAKHFRAAQPLATAVAAPRGQSAPKTAPPLASRCARNPRKPRPITNRAYPESEPDNRGPAGPGSSSRGHGPAAYTSRAPGY